MNKYEQARNLFKDRIKKGMLGPGSDNWGLDEAEEIISDYPLIRYFTGILFPKRADPASQIESDICELENETSDEDHIDEDTEQEITEEKMTVNDKPKLTKIDNLKISHNNFFPNNMAFSICVNENLQKLDVEFSFGIYFQPTYKQTKIKISRSAFDDFFYNKIPFQPPFLEKLKFEDGFMFLNKEFSGLAGGRGKDRSGDFADYDRFKRKENLQDTPTKHIAHILDKLISRAWKRKEIKISQTILLENSDIVKSINLPETGNKNLKVGYNTKVYTYKDKKYFKIQLVNNSKEHPPNKFSNKNEDLNSKCLFQAKIKITSKDIFPFKTQKERMPFDREAEKLNFIYRKISNYAIGHNCSVSWKISEDIKTVETSFIPDSNVHEIKNNLDEITDRQFNQAINIKNLSSFGKPKKEVIADLRQFISFYEKWINSQINESNSLVYQKDIADEIIFNQKANLNRIKLNIDLLKNDKIFESFQLTNLAMLLQITISNDPNFSGKEKEYDEINRTIKYNSLQYFKEYDYKHNLGFMPKYRPFQLAFILLSLDGITDKKSNSRNSIVDLIWFPTGGGKTEAYLAVTAFTIIWRRLNYPNNYDGTTVIMRYTLRLLTAQQFERASRLIAVLEFLRVQKEFKNILHYKPITIGQWIGMSSTPNKLKNAKQKLENLENECEVKNGNPQSKNAFQISSCPWCGTKIITKVNSNWEYGFEDKRNDFKIFCLNEKCHFHKRIPIQVVDEILYKQPPTLLFGTVDKFAMLSWQSESYIFFNTHNKEKLPPDLIIQDELHLLNGPLGSITGLFENVIELLCARDGVSPKIIASTATTRNTDKQIEQLYGNRKVNIFPPQGINYDDSFFAQTDKEKSKRMYLGFMPTGKTAIDTQLHLLAHLIYARLEVYKTYSKEDMFEIIDNYWTIVSYYNSLKDVGKISNKLSDEVTSFSSNLQNRLFKNDDYRFNYRGISKRSKELTSRIASEKIKSTLDEISQSFAYNNFNNKNGIKYLNDVVDLVLSTNMISVGIDVSRLNIMLINGMPRNIAEYIQASSRVGRNTFGIIVTLFSANRAREKSFFEHFIPFHKSFYKNIEPLTVTTFTENTIDKMITSVMIAFLRQYYPAELNKDDQVKFFSQEKIKPLLAYFKKRFNHKPEFAYFSAKLQRLALDLENRIRISNLTKYSELLKRPSEIDESNKDWIVMQSMREIDTSTFIKIKEER